MALFSFRHSVKTFSSKRTDAKRLAKAGQTAAHLRYICRPQAARAVLSERLVGGSVSTAARAAEQEALKRKGRVCERFVIALPVEATDQERIKLSAAFAKRLSCGVAGYVVAIHDCHGNDLNNPHAHFVFFDVQQKTGGRGRPKSTLGLARKHAIENAAKLWAELHNEMMRGWGYSKSSMISHLSYLDRGIDLVPTIHEGAGARAKIKIGTDSKPCWRHIDSGHSRAEANKVIREINKLKEREHERTDRLGSDHESDPAKRQRSFTQQRECRRRDGQTAGIDKPPFIPLGEFESGNSRPPFAANKDQRAERKGRNPNTWGQSQTSAPPRTDNPPNFPMRRGIRRIFHELIMLRDTLQARLSRKDQAMPSSLLKTVVRSREGEQYRRRLERSNHRKI